MKWGVGVLAFMLAAMLALASTDSASKHASKGESLFAAGDFDGAIKEFRLAVRLNPRSSKEHFELGLALKAKGDLDGAVSEYREAIRIDPGLAEAHANIGSILQMQGDLDGAISQYRAMKCGCLISSAKVSRKN